MRSRSAILIEVKKKTKKGRLAQLVERLVYTENVGGSSPSAPIVPNKKGLAMRALFCLKILQSNTFEITYDPVTSEPFHWASVSSLRLSLP